MPRILLIDDNEEGRESLSEILQSTGFDVVTAGDGERGLVLARSARPDLVVMDMNMPVLDGWQTTRTLRTDPATRHLKIIALTGHPLPEDREKAFQAGCCAFHVKPVNFDRLLVQIEEALREGATMLPEPGSASPGK
ncbi:MAG: response regulator [Thermoanaerobaculia bacterium]